MASTTRPSPNLKLSTEGVSFGKYKLLRKLATGGMAEIFLAVQTGIEGFEKPAVIKRILPEHAENREFIAMFLDEARIAATLNHPNITQVFEVGQVDNDYYIAMEYVHGPDMRSIRKRLRELRQQLPIEHALQIVIGACAGLHYAHDRKDLKGNPLNIIHRDVSPQNVLVSFDGITKVVDFGIAKASIKASETRSGVLKGKLSYMSPEQVRGDNLDRRSDVFAVGTLLYEITTTSRLFKANSDFKVLKKIVEEPISPPSVVIPSYPAPLERILMRALAKHREERYQSLREMQEELEDFVREERLRVGTIPLSNYLTDLFQEQVERVRKAKRTGMAHALALAAARDAVDEFAETSIKTTTPGASGEQVAIRPRPSLEEINAEIARTEQGAKTDPSFTLPGLDGSGRRRRRTVLWIGVLAGLFALGGTAAFLLPVTETESDKSRRDDVASEKEDENGSDDAVRNKEIVAALLGSDGLPPEVESGDSDGKNGSGDDAPRSAASEPSHTAVLIKTRPFGAVLTVNGERKGISPASVLLIQGEEHTIVAAKRGYHTTTTSFTPEVGVHEATVNVTLPRVKPIGVASRGTGTIRVGPNRCDVWIDKRKVGSAPADFKAATGKHTVRCRNPSLGIDATKRVDVKAGKIATAVFKPGA